MAISAWNPLLALYFMQSPIPRTRTQEVIIVAKIFLMAIILGACATQKGLTLQDIASAQYVGKTCEGQANLLKIKHPLVNGLIDLNGNIFLTTGLEKKQVKQKRSPLPMNVRTLRSIIQKKGWRQSNSLDMKTTWHKPYFMPMSWKQIVGQPNTCSKKKIRSPF